MAISVAPLTTTVINAVDEANAGTASGINNAVSRLATLLAIAFFGIIMLWSFGSALEGRLATADLPGDVAAAIRDQRASLAAIALPSGLDNTVHETASSVVSEAFVLGYRVIMMIAAILALSSAAIAWLMIEPTQPAPSGEPAARPAVH